MAGGTDIVIEMNEGHVKPDVVIDIKKLKDLEYIRIDGEQLRIGTLSTFAMIASHPVIQERVRVLCQAASKVGSPQIRNLGTIGGSADGVRLGQLRDSHVTGCRRVSRRCRSGTTHCQCQRR